MARGGSRPGAGRRKGSATRRTREIADRASEAGITPLEYMLSVLRDETATPDERFKAAKEAAPYLHPKLASIEHSGPDGEALTPVTRIELVAPSLDDGEA